MVPRLPSLIAVLLLALAAPAARGGPVEVRLDVNGVERTALVFQGSRAHATPAPLVLCFHGFGGTSRNLAASIRLHERWPEATVVYPQGLDYLDGQGRPAAGWQYRPGLRDDRDLAFVDALLERVGGQVQVDPEQVHAVGYSNGAFFVFTLWVSRPEVFAAFAPVAAYAADGILDTATEPRPLLYVFGRGDRVFDEDPECSRLDGGARACAERTIEAARTLNRATGAVKSIRGGGRAWLHEPEGAPTVVYLHRGGHVWPDFATPTIVEFLRAQRRARPTDAFLDAGAFAAIRLDGDCGNAGGKMAYVENRHETRAVRVEVRRTVTTGGEATRTVTVPPASRHRLGCTATATATGEVRVLEWTVVEAEFTDR
jgi:polyhydroxybutyrate depolymerase